ncbi:hypothetical protein [Lysobacter capsici]|uniref:hypothetical protein n=1 Tax=Lysobacter capsici TaxID=435897 RepID=UPI0007166F80|nr:hypothetical protein [Lysobacter capsici]
MTEAEYCVLILDAPCLSQTLWAAWVQAVGSVLAIAVAIAVPFWQHRKDRGDRAADKKLRARSLALAVLGPLQSHHGNLLTLIYQFESEKGNPSRAVVALETRPNKQLEAFIPLSHELGPAASQFQDAMRISQSVSDTAGQADVLEHLGLKRTLKELDDSIPPMLSKARRLTEDAIEAIQGLFT